MNVNENKELIQQTELLNYPGEFLTEKKKKGGEKINKLIPYQTSQP